MILDYKDNAAKIKNDQEVTKFYNSLNHDIWSVNSL